MCIVDVEKNGNNNVKTLQSTKVNQQHSIVLWFTLFLLIFLISVSISLFAHSFNHFLTESFYARSFSNTLANPIIAIFFGAISSVMVRSSSIVITLIAAMVAAGFPFVDAIYILLGANIGTTFFGGFLNRLVNCDIYDKQRIAAITSMHYFNNIIAFCLFFPLQLSSNFLVNISEIMVNWIMSLKEFLTSPLFDSLPAWNLPPVIQAIQESLAMNAYPVTSILILFIIIVILMHLFFIALRLIFDRLIINKLGHQLMKNTKEEKLLLFGIWTSFILQSSSSAFYSLMPLVRKVSCSCRSFYPLILGINVGTCFTTILFSLILQSKLALAIGIAHLFYNFSALIVFTYVPFLRELPILASHQLAFCSYENNTRKDKW